MTYLLERFLIWYDKDKHDLKYLIVHQNIFKLTL